MKQERAAVRVLHILLRPGFGLAIFATQFFSDRDTLFSQSPILLGLGALLLVAAVALWATASVHCSRATNAGKLATSGPYAVIRHPIYASVLLLGLGLGCLFFSWLHLLVVVASVPLWWLESASEEREMTEQFGEEYDAYRQRTSMFIPGIL